MRHTRDLWTEEVYDRPEPIRRKKGRMNREELEELYTRSRTEKQRGKDRRRRNRGG